MADIRFTRRDMLSRSLHTALFAGAALGLSPIVARQVFAAGDAELTVLSDGNLVLPLDFSYPDISQEDLADVFGGAASVPEQLTPDCNVTLYRQGDRLVLFDVGAGPNFMPSAGRLAEALDAAGIDPAEVTDVIFTHAHPDHLWGLVDDFDEVVFPEAQFHIDANEHAFWTDPQTLTDMPEARKSFAVGAASRLARIEDRIALFKPGQEVVQGVEAVATYGHTPGHSSFLVHGGAEPVLIVGDALTHASISFAHPGWPTGADQDAATAAATRAVLLDRLAGEKARIIGYHLPHPGEGRVESTGTAYRFVAD
ncbi:MBL fold metallo-hydrolase [Pseudohoeflea coraliihabitans]|uniref:MBL fold metallo-hydrolase n=1 Tax=Pseudohoeflea coraliihabitans TaxID=2860393 RepID=A0ABS6WR16_9HYPH|nr:MBL fold metallo-hydrolase [Pseudohoeflea sp. DP4N28-3]MBW3098398.1 MBL fold metallo-hydrolase [Pseudohoeflea sp. DP4N28-3]